MAKAGGLHVVADASPGDAELVKSLGVDEVVARGDGVSAAIRAVAPKGVDGLIDSAAVNALVLPAITDGGGVAVIRGWEGPTERGITLHAIRSARSFVVPDFRAKRPALVSRSGDSLKIASQCGEELVG